jgi:hypothetical protein
LQFSDSFVRLRVGSRGPSAGVGGASGAVEGKRRDEFEGRYSRFKFFNRWHFLLCPFS